MGLRAWLRCTHVDAVSLRLLIPMLCSYGFCSPCLLPMQKRLKGFRESMAFAPLCFLPSSMALLLPLSPHPPHALLLDSIPLSHTLYPISHTLTQQSPLPQNSLVAERAWHPGEVLGEYCGKVAADVHSGDYVACLLGHQGDSSGSVRALLVSSTMLGIDALSSGNQVRPQGPLRSDLKLIEFEIMNRLSRLTP